MIDVFCPQCGLSAVEFNRSGRLGCGECYRAFGADLAIVLRRLHGGGRHIGKIPAPNAVQLEARTALLTLRRQLKQAVEREEFEKAAELRDRITLIEKAVEPQEPATS